MKAEALNRFLVQGFCIKVSLRTLTFLKFSPFFLEKLGLPAEKHNQSVTSNVLSLLSDKLQVTEDIFSYQVLSP